MIKEIYALHTKWYLWSCCAAPILIFLWTVCYAKIGHDGAMTDQNTCLVAKGYTKFFGKDYIDKVPGF